MIIQRIFKRWNKPSVPSSIPSAGSMDQGHPGALETNHLRESSVDSFANVVRVALARSFLAQSY